MTSLAVLEKTACLTLRISRWTGRSRLRVEDLGEAAKKMPPEELASLGSLKLCSPKRLRRVGAIQRAAERDCARVSVRFLGGYATELPEIAHLVKKLTKHQANFLAEAESIAHNLQAVIDDWTALHPAWKDIINEKVPASDDIKSRYRFQFRAYRVAPASLDPIDGVNTGLEEAATGLSDQLFKEIEAEARRAWKSSYEGKTSVSQKALRPLKAILGKLETLSYLDMRCQPIIDQFRRVLGSLPIHGPIEDPHLSAVIGLFRVVQTGDTIRSHGSAQLKRRDTPQMPSDLLADDASAEDEDENERESIDPTPADVDEEVAEVETDAESARNTPQTPRHESAFWL